MQIQKQRPPAAALVIAAAVTLLVGCTTATGSNAPEDPSTVKTDPISHAAPAASRPVPWRLYSLGHHLNVVKVQVPGCTVITKITLHETAKRAVVTVYGTDKTCTTSSPPVRRLVHLPKIVGCTRLLYDGATNRHPLLVRNAPANTQGLACPRESVR